MGLQFLVPTQGCQVCWNILLAWLTVLALLLSHKIFDLLIFSSPFDLIMDYEECVWVLCVFFSLGFTSLLVVCQIVQSKIWPIMNSLCNFGSIALIILNKYMYILIECKIHLFLFDQNKNRIFIGSVTIQLKTGYNCRPYRMLSAQSIPALSYVEWLENVMFKTCILQDKAECTWHIFQLCDDGMQMLPNIIT